MSEPPRDPGVGPTPQTPGPRLLELDGLRGIALVLMVQQHLGVWLWRGVVDGTHAQHPVFLAINASGGRPHRSS